MTSGDSDLTAIRTAELAAARRAAGAREQAAESLERAREEARRLVDHGRREGLEMAMHHYEGAVAAAESRAAEIAGLPTERIARLRSIVEPRLDELVEAMLEVILAPPEEMGV